MAQRVTIVGLDVLPSGPKRELTLALQDLYVAAGFPSVRSISIGIRKDDDIKGSLSHTVVHEILRGLTFTTRWEHFQALVHFLVAAQVDPEEDIEGAKKRIYRLWRRANSPAESFSTAHRPPASSSAADSPAEDLQLPGEPSTGQGHEQIDDAGDPGAAIHSEPDLQAAHRWYTQQIEAGDTDAAILLGTLLACRPDPPRITAARRLYEQAAEAGSIDAMIKIADLSSALEPIDPEAALLWYQRAAEAGSLPAMIQIADLHETHPQTVDSAVAEVWLEKAATAGSSEAMRRLGVHIYKAEPSREDEAKAWCEQATRAANPAAMRTFGLILQNQSRPDYPGARWWIEKSAAAGDVVAMINLALILDSGKRGDLLDRFSRRYEPEDSSGSRNWLERAADAGSTDAMLLLARRLLDRYFIGRRQVGAATMWLQTAANAGCQEAMLELASLMETVGNASEAARWYDQYYTSTGGGWDSDHLTSLVARSPYLLGARDRLVAVAEGGHVGAMRELAIQLRWKAPRDGTEARKWHEKALGIARPSWWYWYRWWGFTTPRSPR